MSAAHPEVQPSAGQIRLRYWAAARAAAGVEEDFVETAATLSLDELIGRVLDLHGGSPGFSALLTTCSVLVGDRPVAAEDPAAVVVSPGETVEFLPPFAGG